MHPWKLCRYKGCKNCCSCAEECNCLWQCQDTNWFFKPIETDEDMEYYVYYAIYYDKELNGTFQVKWDGCSNLWDLDQYAFHFCDFKMMDEFNNLLKELYSYTTDLIGRP